MKTSLGIAAAIALLSCGSAYAGAPNWTVSESSGRVVILRSGVSQIAVRGGALSPGDSVSTLGNSRAVLVRGGEYLVVSPNSRIRIADPITSGGFTQIIQDLGNTIFRIKKQTTPHFAVETPFLAAVVKGTTFSVTVTDAGTAVQVTEGLVQVSTADGGATHLVRPGDIGLVDAAMPLRLKIEGKEAMVIDSPNKPNATPAPSASIAASATTAFAEEASKNDAADSHAAEPDVVVATEPKVQPAASASMFDSVIGSAVSEGPVRLETVSGGLVTGNSALLIATNSVLPVQLVALSDSPPATVLEVAPVADASPMPQATPAIDAAPVPEVAPVMEVTPVVEVAVVPNRPVEAPPLDVAGVSAPQPANVTAALTVEVPVVQVAIVDVSVPTIIVDASPTVTVVEVPASINANNGNAGGSPSSGSTSSASATVSDITNAPSNSGKGSDDRSVILTPSNGSGNGNGNGGNVPSALPNQSSATVNADVGDVSSAPSSNGNNSPAADVQSNNGNGNGNGNGGSVQSASSNNGSGNANANGSGVSIAPSNSASSGGATSTTAPVATSTPATRPSGAEVLNFIIESIKAIRAANTEPNRNPNNQGGRGR